MRFHDIESEFVNIVKDDTIKLLQSITKLIDSKFRLNSQLILWLEPVIANTRNL